MLADIIRKYQRYNPQTGAFDAERNTREYAELTGIPYVYLRQIITGARQPGTTTFAKLMRAFPGAREAIASEMAAALGTRPAETVP